MAHKEHLEILKQGIRVWNQWRKDNPDLSPDLSKADLSGENFVRANLSRANLNRVNFNKASLYKANLNGADLRRANLREANLEKVKLVGANLTRANIVRAILTEANLSKACLCWTNLSEANLNKAKLGGANLTKANLIRADLSHANLSDSTLSEAVLIGADLSETDFVRANLRGADFIRAHLIRANLSGANLSEAKLSEANLSQVNLSRANLSRANLSGAKFYKVHLNSTIFANTNLANTDGLETIIHLGPSSVGIDTLYRSKGKIPKIFLRGAGVPSALIEYLYPTIGKENPIYSCFISYSIEDQEFVERLYLDLQAKGIHVWLTTEDVKDKRQLQEFTIEANRPDGKLLLVLSEHNLKCEWVKTVIYSAHQYEVRSNTRMLFPVGLVGFNTDSNYDILPEIRGTLIDFSDWKNFESYKKSLGQLLQELHDWE